MKKRILIALLGVLTLLVCATAAISPAKARTLNSSVWTGKVGPAQQLPPVDIGDDLLKAGGHTIILSQRTEGFTVPITVTANEDVTGALTVSAADNTWFTVLPESVPITLQKGESQTVNFAVTLIRDAEQQQGSPSMLTFGISWNSTGTVLTGTFEMLDEDSRNFDFLESNGQLNGVIDDPPEWYSAKHPLFLSIDGAARLKFSRENEILQHGFPAGTTYTFGGVEYVLYDGGFIDLGTGGRLLIDFSNTDVHGSIRLSTDSSSFELDELDAIEGVVLDTPLISSTGATSVNLSYNWGGITPTFTARQLTQAQDGTFSWTATDRITCREGTDGNIYLDTRSALAGTYLVNFAWTLNGNTLYSAEMELFVRYASGGQGGSAN